MGTNTKFTHRDLGKARVHAVAAVDNSDNPSDECSDPDNHGSRVGWGT
jgi:hypothetical protein